jgi:hypothetical protein
MEIEAPRYAQERNCMDLAIRMIHHEARTYTIRSCTGLGEDRIRKLYNVYFKQEGAKVTRHRGKTPRHPGYFVQNPLLQLHATTLVRACMAAGLLHLSESLQVTARVQRDTPAFGQRFCDAYEAYLTLHQRPDLSFERAWNLLDGLCRGNEIGLGCCRECQVVYLQDRLNFEDIVCPACCLRQVRGQDPKGARA